MHFFTETHTLDQIEAAVRANTALPESYVLTVPGHTIQIWYGDPDRDHVQVKHFHGRSAEKDSYTDFDAATTHFLTLCADVLK